MPTPLLSPLAGWARVLVPAAMVFQAACASDSLQLPSDGAPARVVIVDGNGQSGVAGRALAESLIVSVTDGADRPVTGLVLGFQASDGGAVSPSTILTDDAGRATFRWVLGPTAGAQQLDAGHNSSGSLTSKVTFRATANAGPVNTIARVSGDGQIGPAGQALALPLVVKLVDEYGNPVAGKNVSWSAAAGTLSRTTVSSQADGSASVQWTLGTGTGVQSVTARFQGAVGSPVTFSATALQTGSPRLVVVTQPSTTAEDGVKFSRQPSLQLRDAQGNRVMQAGIPVTAAVVSSSGTLGGTTTKSTDGSGVAQFTDLSISGAAGPYQLIFAAVGYTAATSGTVQLVSLAPSGPSAQQTSANVPSGKPFRWTRITIISKDAAGNRLTQGGYAGQFRVNVTGANTASNLSVNDEGDGTYEAFYLPIAKGTDYIEITFGGAPIKGSPYKSKVN